MPLTQFETDSIIRAVVALERIADTLELIKERMPEAPVSGGLAELDACDFPCDKGPKSIEPIPCYLWDDHGQRQPCIREDMDCGRCKRHKAHLRELALLEKDIHKVLEDKENKHA